MILKNPAEENVSKFYDTIGWETHDGVTEDARRWEDLRDCARDYVRKCRLRVLRHIPESGDLMLDMASGPIQYPEYLEFSAHFRKRYCIDLSKRALQEAERKIGSHGVFIGKSFFDVQFDDNMFDCSISLHTIYHIDRDLQEDAVRKLIRVTKTGQPIIIVYSNPLTLTSRALTVFRKLRQYVQNGGAKGKKDVSYKKPPILSGSDDSHDLYFYAHQLSWWERFHDAAEVKFFPWRSYSSDEQKTLFPDNFLGKYLLRLMFTLEDAFPRFFVRHFRFPMIVITKRS